MTINVTVGFLLHVVNYFALTIVSAHQADAGTKVLLLFVNKFFVAKKLKKYLWETMGGCGNRVGWDVLRES